MVSELWCVHCKVARTNQAIHNYILSGETKFVKAIDISLGLTIKAALILYIYIQELHKQQKQKDYVNVGKQRHIDLKQRFSRQSMDKAQHNANNLDLYYWNPHL